jgi:hypothetical protein
MVASIAFAHEASIGSTATVNGALGDAVDVVVLRTDGVGRAAVVGETDGAETCVAVRVQALATQTTSAADIQRRREWTGSLLTCSPS